MLREAFKDGQMDKYSWPGGYPLVALMDDGESLCPDCVNSRTNPIHVLGEPDGWKIEAVYTIGDDESDYCAHCSKQIPPAYGN